MPRQPRLIVPDTPVHIVQRGNNRQPIFAKPDDFRYYLYLLQDHARPTGCRLHAYVLMTNHVHLLVTPSSEDSAGTMMKVISLRYARRFNREYERSGTLWEGRFRSTLIDTEHYLLACYRYIELNPVRAGLAVQPGGYAWSSYRANAEGERNWLLEPHPLYSALGHNDGERCAAYRALFGQELGEDVVEKIRSGH